MYVKLLTNNFLSEKAVGKSESKDVHLAVLRVLPEVIRESVDAEQHADYRKGEGGKGTEGERRDAGRIVAVNQGKRDGSGIDADASSKSVIIYDPATGEKKMVSPTAVDGIESLGEVKTAEQREAEINAHMQDTIQRSKDWLEGNVANPVGMQIQLGDGRFATIEAMHEDGKSAIATLPDGTQFLVPNDVLQRIVNNGQYADYKARRDAEASKREAEQSTESAPETATEGGQPLPEEASPKEEERREFAQGDVFDVVVDGQKMHAEIVSPKDADGRFVVNVDDGESMRTLYVTPEELAAMEYREEPSPKAEETRLATEDSSDKALERGAQPTEEHTPTALERIPRDEKGNAQFHDVDTETAWDGLVEMSGNEETAHKVAEASLANAEKKLKAAKALKEKGETPEELLRSIKENEAAAAEAQRAVDAWKAIVGEKSRREEAAKAEAERIATEKAEAERKAAEERERAEAEEKARIEAERKAEEERKTKEEERKERDENGQPFVVSSDGTTTFGEITEDTGLTAAPIKLSEGVADEKGNGYGLRHIEARHGDQIRKAGFSSVEEFVKYVASNYDKHNIKIGKKRANGVETYLIQAEDEHSNMLYVELSKDGSYWNVNSGGIFRKGYAEKKKDVGQNTEHPTSATTLQDKSFVQTDKDNGSQSADTHSDKQHPSADKGTTLAADQQSSDKENTKKVADSEGENTLKAKIEAASADVNTDPTEAQKEAGNYKKGHVQVGTFDITIEQPEGSIRRGTDADGKKWESKMHNTYGYFRGTEGVDGDHIDVFLSNDIDGWNGRKVFVVDQYNPDGTFDEHKVMLGFNDMDEAKSDYLANYEKGWENGRRITVSTTNLEDFKKWIDSSHRKTKPFSEYSSVNKETVATDKGGEKAEKKQEKQSVFDKAKEIADKEEKKRKAEADKPKQKPLTEAERKDAEEVAGALGYRVEWVDTMEENGTIDADKKVIRIAKDAENPLVQVLGHEVAHGVKRMDGGKFKALQKAAMEVVGEKEWNERIEKKRKLNAYAEGKLAEEVTCDIVGEALNDKEALKRLAESLRGERGILARLRDAVAKMVEYFKNRGDKEGVRRMKAADKLLAEFESALKEGANERRLSPDTPIRLVNADADHGFKNYEEARAWAKENIARTYGNDETGGKGEIRISNTAIGKFLSEKAVGKSESKDVHLAVLRVLPDVIRESVDAEQHADYRKGADGKRGGNGVNPDVTMHILYGAVTIDGKTYRVKTTLKENVRDNEPTKAYTYEATKIELLAGPNEKATVSTFSRDSNNSITAAKLLKDVKKSYSNEEFFADENVERSVMEKGELTDAEVAEKERDIDHSVRSSKEMAEERLEIERKAKSDGTWLKAPNGKRTNLNERQWVDVRTKNFKEWFGDWENDPENASKIVDENGEPLMVFHYTPEDFTVFGEGKEIGASTFYNASDANYAATAAVGDWFTSKSDLPDYMGKPMRVFLNIKEPSDGRSLEVLADEVGYEISSKDYEAFDEDRDNTAPIIEAGKNYQEKLRDRGYDGIFIADEEFGGTSYITFAPNQIKSAVENDGSYSPKENDIRRSVREGRSEKTELTAAERELRDNLVERMRKGGLDVVTDSEEMQRVIDTENERTRMMGAGSVREHRVYHGSGADFDAFDHSHMGEGEGAQAYGWGTYVTEVEGIGRTYAIQNTTTHNDALRALQHDVDAISDQLNRHRDDLKYDEEQLKRANEWRAEAELDYELFRDEAEELKEKYGESSPKYRNHLFNDIYTDEMKRAQSSVKSTEESIQYRKEKIAELEKALKDKQAEIDELPKEFPRHLYTVEIPDDNGSNYLDWNGHPAESLLKDVGSFLESNGFERVQDSPVRYEKGESTVVLNPNATGADLYAELREALGSDKKASQALAELGCIGIKYPADNMRGGREDGAKNYVIFNENDAKITDHTRFLRTADGEVYGLVKDGRIYLDPKVATSETPVHEYAHLWAEALRNGNPKEWQNVVELMKGTKVWDEVKARYPELKSDDEIADEVIATYSGRRGAERLREEQRKIAEGNGGVFEKAEAVNALERVKQALNKFWNGVADFLHIHYKSAEEVADRVMKDLLEGVDPRKMGKTKDGGVRFSAKQKRALETASLGNVPRSLTVVSSAAGANVLNNIENLAKEFEKSATQPKTFIGDVAKALGASRFGSGSEYATFETKNGNIVTIRLANHNAHVSGFDHNDKDNGISIVISPKPNEGITNDGNAHITEFYYDSIKLRRAEGKPLAEIVRSIKQALYSGEFKDTTGLAERQEVNGEDVIRYQSSSENSDKTLAGVHNITEEKLRKALKLGGLANPSVAVIDISKNSHEGFGEISLILPSEKVAKRTGKNAGTWQGDAWTPTYPQIERRMSNKGAEKASKDVLSVPSDMYSEVRIGLDRWLDSGEANSAMAYMFLHEKGVAPEPKKIQPKFSDEAYNELKSITAGNFNIYGISKADAQKVLAMYIDAYFDGDKDLYEDKTKAWLEKNRSIVDAGDKGGMRYAIAKENVKLYDEYGFNYRGVQTFVRDVEYDHRNTGVDMNATLNEVEDYIKTNSLTDEFNTWQEGKEKEYGIKEVIFDGFTPSGNRRYIPNTLENVSKIMKKQGRNGATGAWASFPNFAARLMPSYGTLEDIRSKKGLLTSDREKIDDFREKWSKVFFELGMKCQPDATGTFDDYGFDRLSEAAMTSDPQAFLKQEYNVDFSDEDTKRLKKMVKAIKEEYPAMYFETKFERPVYLNEFAAVVVPNDLGADVKKALSDLGIAMYEYDASKEGDRSRAFDEAVKSSGKIRFQFIGEKGAAEADHAEEVLPTLTTGGGDIIIMPDGRVLKASPRVLARVTGLPDTYKMPETDQLSHTIVGNGIPTQLTEGVIAPLLDNAIPSAERATKRESVFDVADRVSQNLEERTRAMAELIAEQPVEEINNRFNEELEKYQNNELPKGHRFELGMPSAELQSAGFPTLPISMRSSLLAKKAGAERHPFAPTDLRDLVNAIQKPIAIFNYSKNNMRNLIVDVSRGGKHFLVGVTLNYKADNIEINSVSGLFPKENHEWIKWIQDGKVLRIDQKEKVQDLINSLRTNPAESERIGLNLDDVAKKVKDFENPKLFDGKISEVDKNGSDSIDRSVRENPKNEDKPRYSRKPGESIFDYASRVSEDVDRSVRERVSARDEYEKKVKSKGFQTKEALQNSMLGLQEFMSAIDHASGNKRYIEDIPDFENPILGENRLSSVNKEEMHQVAKTQFKPLMSAVAKLSGNGKESGELYDYMFAKHGLERDAVMRQREAQKEFDKYQKANPKGTKTIGDFVASLEGKDYAGLTALTAEDGRVKSIQSQIDAIDEQMKATDDQLLLHYLGGQKKRLKVDLLNAARDAADDIRKAFENNPSHDRSDINELWSRVNEVNGNTLRKLYESGMLTKEAYNDISSMYTNYIPMRGFDQTTSADAYAYLTHGDSAEPRNT